MDGHIPLAKLKARNWNAFPADTGGQVDNPIVLFFRLRGKTACQGDWDIQVGKSGATYPMRSRRTGAPGGEYPGLRYLGQVWQTGQV